MRTLKFRLIKNDKIVGYELWHENKWVYAHTNDNFNLYTPFIEHDMKNQFIGFPDKLGKEIYEGDILKEYWEPCGDEAAVCGEYIGEVFYEDAGYWTKSKNHHHAITETYDSYEVIGNIYENPELLEK